VIAMSNSKIVTLRPGVELSVQKPTLEAIKQRRVIRNLAARRRKLRKRRGIRR
jgi:hypothetical protein